MESVEKSYIKVTRPYNVKKVLTHDKIYSNNHFSLFNYSSTILYLNLIR